MHTVLIVTLVIYVCSVTGAQLGAHLRQFRESEEHCKKVVPLNAEEKTSSILATYVLKGEISDDHNGKCIAQCMLEDSKMVHYDGAKFVPGNVDEVKFARSSTMKDRIRRNVGTCLETVEDDPDPCVKGAKIFKCLIDDHRSEINRIAEFQNRLEALRKRSGRQRKPTPED